MGVTLVHYKNMSFTMIIPGRLCGANDIITATNIHRFKGAGIKKMETKRCALAAVVNRLPVFKFPVSVEFHWFEPNKKRDLDNIRYGAKFILDGLRLANKLQNDGWSWVMNMSDKFYVDPKNPRIEVYIKEITIP